MITQFHQFEGFTCTIHTNDNCNLKCAYCYETGKAHDIESDDKFWKTTKYADNKRSYNFVKKSCAARVVKFETAKQFLKSILDYAESPVFDEAIEIVRGEQNDYLIVDFIGGDSLQYPELLDQIATWLTRYFATHEHRWKYRWMMSISSNGVTLLNPNARKFCEKWKNKLSLGMSIDGCPEYHDLNRFTFANDGSGKKMGSWKYIMEVWPWFIKNFQNDSQRTKWTVAPNGYKYLLDSVKFLHEKLGMTTIFFNRVMEEHMKDTAEDVMELISQFSKIKEYVIEHHLDLMVDPFNYVYTTAQTKQELLEENADWSRCGFGKMPALAFDNNVYPCFRMVPGSNELKDPTSFRQGTYNDIFENLEMLKSIQHNSKGCNLRTPEKCEKCKLYSICPHCAAGCVTEDGTLLKTTSVCNYIRVQMYFVREYWSTITKMYPELYRDYRITWTQEENDELIKLVLEDAVNLKNQEKLNDC
jgi:uncharacterized protein